ncbi:hypothetical protein BKA69DRAFT_235548 [Paraphysoderma sedebokerense]|nr:hypothetical protein BKA69DRAFT_235548 [Paraphysoderma sedebokerense]
MGWKLTKILIQYKMTFVKGGYMHEKYSERTVVAVDSKGVENTESSDIDENALVEQSMDELEVLPFEIHPVQFIEGEDDVGESEEEETLSDVDDIEISTRSGQSADEISDQSVEKDASVDENETTQDDSHPIEIEDSISQASNLPESAVSFCPNTEEEGYIAAPVLEADLNSSPSNEVEHSAVSDELLFVIDKTPTVNSSAEVATEDTRTALGEPVHAAAADDDDDQWTDDSGETDEDATMADFDLQNYDNEPLNPIFSGVVPPADTSISTSSRKAKKRRTRRGGARVRKQKEKANEDERHEELEIMIDYLRNVNGAGDTALPGDLDQLALDELLSMGLDVNLQQKELSSFASHDLELDESDESDSEMDDSDEYSESDGSGESDLEHGLLEELSDSDSDLDEGDLDSDDSAYIESLKQGQNDIFESDEEAQYLIDSAFPEEGRWNENGQAPGRRKAEAKMKRIMQGSFEEDDSSEEDGEESAQNQPMSKTAKRKIDRKLKKQERHARKAARKDQERMVYGISKDESWGKKSKKKRMKGGGVIIDFGSIHKLIKDFVKDVDGYHSLPLPPLPSTARRAVTRLAGCYNLKTKSKGSGKSKMSVLIRTSRTAYPDVDDYQSWNKIDAIISETDKKIGISNKTYNDVNARKKGKGRSTGEGGGRNTCKFLFYGSVLCCCQCNSSSITRNCRWT